MRSPGPRDTPDCSWEVALWFLLEHKCILSYPHATSAPVWGGMKLGKRSRSLSFDTDCNLGVSQTTLRFDNLLEGFTEFRNAIEFTVYYSELIQVKISQEKRGMGQHPGKYHAWSFQLSPTSGVTESVNSPGNAE